MLWKVQMVKCFTIIKKWIISLFLSIMAQNNAVQEFPDIAKLKTKRIRAKLKEGLPPIKIVMWFASKAISKALSESTDEPFDELIEEFRSNLILTTEEANEVLKHLLHNENLKAFDKVCTWLENKSKKDVEDFLEILQEKPQLGQLTQYLEVLIERCKQVEADEANQCYEVTQRIDVPGNHEDGIFTGMNTQGEKFQVMVLPVGTKITAVKQGSILLTVRVADQWDVQNIQHDISSGAFQERFIYWLKDIGLDLSKEEQEAVTFTIINIEEIDDTVSDDTVVKAIPQGPKEGIESDMSDTTLSGEESSSEISLQSLSSPSSEVQVESKLQEEIESVDKSTQTSERTIEEQLQKLNTETKEMKEMKTSSFHSPGEEPSPEESLPSIRSLSSGCATESYEEEQIQELKQMEKPEEVSGSDMPKLSTSDSSTSPPGFLIDHITCSVCLEIFKKPYTLRCLHTCCKNCILHLSERNKINCPVCREQTRIFDIKFDFRVQSLIDIHTNSVEGFSRELVKAVCDACGTAGKIVDSFCTDCYMLLCSDCFKGHKRIELLKQHNILTVTEFYKWQQIKIDKEIQKNVKVKANADRLYTRTVDSIKNIQHAEREISQEKRDAATVKQSADDGAISGKEYQQIDGNCDDSISKIRSRSDRQLHSLKQLQKFCLDVGNKLAERTTLLSDILQSEDYIPNLDALRKLDAETDEICAPVFELLHQKKVHQGYRQVKCVYLEGHPTKLCV